MNQLLLLTLALAPRPDVRAQEAAPSEGARPAAGRAGDGLLFVEVPDLPALLKAYEQAPVVRMVCDQAVRDAVGGILESTGVQIAPRLRGALEGMGLPSAVAEAPLAAARGMLGQVRSARLALTLADEAGALSDTLGKTLRALVQMEQLQKAVDGHTQENQGYPPATLDELELPDDLRLDPWGHPFSLTVDLTTLEADMSCLGADGRAGGEGFDADLPAGGGAQVAEQLISHSLGVVIEVDFVLPDFATGFAAEMTRRIESLGWDVGEEREVALGGAPSKVCVLEDPATDARSAWMLRQDGRLLVGYGAGSLERTLAVGGKLQDLVDPATGELSGEALALGRYLEEPSGATVLWGASRLAPLERLLASIERDLKAQGGIQVQRLPLGGDGLFRMRLDGERFVSELASHGRAAAETFAALDADFLRCIGTGPLPAPLWEFVPAEAIGVFATSLDGQALYEEILKSLGAQAGERPSLLTELEARHGFSIDRDLIANLGDGAAAYLLPITAVVSIPGIAVVVELRDAERFQAGLDGLLRLLEEQAGGQYGVRYKPYRDQPLWTFTFGGDESGGTGFAGALSVSPSLAIVRNHLIVTLTSLRAKKEIKRLLEGQAEPHRLLASETAAPPDATTVAFMDWPAFLDGTYEGARAALALFGGVSGELPVDPELLPASDTFTRFLRPTVMWSRKPAPDVRITHLESSFGPETWLAILGGAALAVRFQSSAPLESAAEQDELSAPDPEQARAAAESERTLAEVATRLEVFRIESGRYPRRLEELLQPTDNFPRGYLERASLPADGWGRGLAYHCSGDGSSYGLWSVGENGTDEGGGGDDVRVP